MPHILDRAVSKIKARGVPESKAYAFAVSRLQKAGELEKGSLKATAKGVKRGRMTSAERARTR